MSYIDVTGKTEDEAIRKALAQLGMDRDDVSVEILERAKSGFLGLGGNPARVRVTYTDPEEEKVAPVEEKPVVAAEPAKKQPVEKKQDKKPEKKAEKKAEKPAAKQEVKVEKVAEPAEEGLCSDANAQRICAFREGLLAQLDSKAEIKVYEAEKGRYKVILEGQKLGALIGRRGETLDAIQQLTNYAVNSGSEKRIRVHVDAENYRAKREQSLVALASKVAAKVVKYRRSVTLEPMNAYERHVIHSALQETAYITTYSIGTEPNRRVEVSYDRDKR